MLDVMPVAAGLAGAKCSRSRVPAHNATLRSVGTEGIDCARESLLRKDAGDVTLAGARIDETTHGARARIG
jgi:hypothetical protein